MQSQQHDGELSPQFEHYEVAESVPGSELRSRENSATEGELRRYEEEEIVTKPWPPQSW